MTCALKDKDCAGRLEWHHAIKQQRLRREFKHGAVWRHRDGRWVPCSRHDPVKFSQPPFTRSLDDILGDGRNRVWVCSHHHEMVTKASRKVELPPEVWEFARVHGMEAQLENDLARQR